MKRVLIVFLLIFLLLGIFCGCERKSNEEYLRIHIRANSNSELDQAIKMQVKNEVVTYLSKKLENCSSKQEAIEVISSELDTIEILANTTLHLNGMQYDSSAIIQKEDFPTRSYGDLTLESGEYDALIINLGSGEGDNWWCIVFPPLCFVDKNNNREYKSFLYELFKKYFC